MKKPVSSLVEIPPLKKKEFFTGDLPTRFLNVFETHPVLADNLSSLLCMSRRQAKNSLWHLPENILELKTKLT